MQRMRRDVRKRSGFTLLELMVVMVILVILAGVVTVMVMNRIDDANRARAIADVKLLETAMEHYKYDNKDYPTTEQGLDALRSKPQGDELPKWNGPYVKHSLKDPWDREYIYKSPGDHSDIDISTLGKDGKEGGEKADADIESWNIQ